MAGTSALAALQVTAWEIPAHVVGLAILTIAYDLR